MILCQNLSSGSTAVCVLVEGDELHVAWLGDSQALLVRDGQPIKLVTPHKPEDEVSLCVCVTTKPSVRQLSLQITTRLLVLQPLLDFDELVVTLWHNLAI